MALLTGLLLALAAGLLGTFARMDRDRAFYTVIMIVVGSYYSLFAAMGASMHSLLPDSLIGVLFAAAAVAGFRWSMWIVVVALAAHGVFDFAHDLIIQNPGVPRWWPAFCATYDVTAAAYLAVTLKLRATDGLQPALTAPPSRPS